MVDSKYIIKLLMDKRGWSFEERLLLFRRKWFLCKVFLTLAIISLIASIVFFYIGGWVLLLRPWAVGEPTYSIRCVFFLLLAIILFLINLSIHKICDDVSGIL